MRTRGRLEGFLFGTVFALAYVFPVGLILVTIASLVFPDLKGYDDSLVGLFRGLVRDARSLGIAGTVPCLILLTGIGLAARQAARRRAGLPAKLVGGATILTILSMFLLASDPHDVRAMRVAIALGATGFLVFLLAAGWDAWRATRGSR